MFSGGVVCTPKLLGSRAGTAGAGAGGGNVVVGSAGVTVASDMDVGGGGGGGGGDEVSVEPSELFNELGVLVVESRMPERSSKGRTQGPHCPLTVGILPKHKCDQKQNVVSILCVDQSIINKYSL